MKRQFHRNAGSESLAVARGDLAMSKEAEAAKAADEIFGKMLASSENAQTIAGLKAALASGSVTRSDVGAVTLAALRGDTGVNDSVAASGGRAPSSRDPYRSRESETVVKRANNKDPRTETKKTTA